MRNRLSNFGVKVTVARFCTLIFVVLVVSFAKLGVAKTIQFEVDTDGYDGLGYWIGTFVQPLTVESKPKSWKLIESTITTLQIAEQEDLVFVAFQKGSLPIIRYISSNTTELSIELQFQKGKSIHGEIRSADGFPIKNAVVSVEHVEGLRSHQFPDETMVLWQGDQDGKYVISGLPSGTNELQITARSGLPAELQILQIEDEDPDIKVVDLRLQSVYFILGNVVDDEDQQIGGAEVVASEWIEELTSIKTLTDEKGLFRIGPFFTNKSIWVEARVSGYGFSEVQRVEAGQTDLRLTLRKLLVLKGTVVERDTGALVEEFTVSALSGLGNTSRELWTNAYTFDGSMGTFSIEVDPRITHVIIEAPGFAFRFIPIDSVTGLIHDIGTIELDKGRIVAGSVVDVSTSHPIVGAEVRYTQWGNANTLLAFYTYNYLESIETDNRGEFTLSSLPNEELTVEISADGYFHSETVLSEEQESFRVELQKISHPTIQGRVQSIEGSPLNAELVLHNVEFGTTDVFTTNSDGTFEILANDGTYDLQARKSGFGDSNSETVVVKDQDIVANVLLIINTSGNSISGSVTGLLEAESLIVKVYNADLANIRDAYLYGNESYRFGGLAEGQYRIEGKTSLNRKISKRVVIDANHSAVSVDLAFTGISNLQGVVMAAGKPVGNVRVWAEPKTDGHLQGEAMSQEDGSYLIEHLDDGEYNVHTDRGLSFEVLITNDTFFDIDVGDLSFAGTVVSKRPTRNMVVVLTSDLNKSVYMTSKVRSDGTFRIDGLSAGSYVIRVTKSGRNIPSYAKSTYSLRLDHSLEEYQIELESD